MRDGTVQKQGQMRRYWLIFAQTVTIALAL
jgi:hypothetical protein